MQFIILAESSYITLGHLFPELPTLPFNATATTLNPYIDFELNLFIFLCDEVALVIGVQVGNNNLISADLAYFGIDS